MSLYCAQLARLWLRVSRVALQSPLSEGAALKAPRSPTAPNAAAVLQHQNWILVVPLADLLLNWPLVVIKAGAHGFLILWRVITPAKFEILPSVSQCLIGVPQDCSAKANTVNWAKDRERCFSFHSPPKFGLLVIREANAAFRMTKLRTKVLRTLKPF